MITMRSRDRSN